MPDVDDVVRVLGELRRTIACHGDDGRTDTMDDGQDLHDLLHLAAVGNRQDYILVRHHAEVAVKRLRRVHEERGRARARKRRGDFAPDMSGFSHARDDDASRAAKHALDRTAELLIHIFRQLLHCCCFQRQRFLCLFPYHISFHSPLSFCCDCKLLTKPTSPIIHCAKSSG